ncbi:MAG TPA: 3-carboxy-cis,cis-muconate cycloisomerase [Gaiellaceae bacterium]|jgi:3-carboxy-cis,cis-muconate cycloisomerase|nr:3-carboxy-cis,cis-muconate cycloisomerase [Gaiellaceae bacterium]
MTFDAIFVPAALRAAVSDRAWFEAMLEVERALANAEAIAGVIPAHLAGPIAEACVVERFDVESIVASGRSAGNPAEPLVRALRAAVGGDAAEFVHFGATSQDIVDSAAMLVSRRAVELILEELDGLAVACASLAEAHRDTPMAARTLLQQAVPTTFGLKAAGWLSAVLTAREHVWGARLPSQLGGAAGTLAALGADGPAVARQFAEELDLAEPELPWHSDRSRIAALGLALAIAAGVCAKIGLDVALLEQTEVGEVREPAGAGGSSAMPQKRNPVGSAIAGACGRRVAAASGVLVDGLVGEHERSVGAWHAEWGALSEALAFTGGAAAAMREVLEGLEVDTERMRANLQLGGGAAMSEHALLVLSPRVGREEALRLVKAAAASGSLRDGLSGSLGPDEVDAILDPTTYLGSAGQLVDRMLAVYRDSVT